MDWQMVCVYVIVAAAAVILARRVMTLGGTRRNSMPSGGMPCSKCQAHTPATSRTETASR